MNSNKLQYVYNIIMACTMTYEIILLNANEHIFNLEL